MGDRGAICSSLRTAWGLVTSTVRRSRNSAKVLAQLKNGYAFETIPTRNFAANSTWQILSVLAHNLITNFQIALASPQRPASAKRRSLFRLRSIHTLRYELLGRAGLVRHPEGRATLTLAPNLPTQKLFENIVAKLASAA